MTTLRRRLKLGVIALAGLAPIFGACVTTNELRDFILTEIAVVSTNIIADPIDDSLSSLVGPQVVEEVVPSI